MEDLDHKYIDVEVEAQFKRGAYNGTRSLDTKRFRVVGVLVADADDYHLYITNLPRDEVLPSDLAPLYRCRWEVELLFCELKTQYELDEFDTSKKYVVEILGSGELPYCVGLECLSVYLRTANRFVTGRFLEVAAMIISNGRLKRRCLPRKVAAV